MKTTTMIRTVLLVSLLLGCVDDVQVPDANNTDAAVLSYDASPAPDASLLDAAATVWDGVYVLDAVSTPPQCIVWDRMRLSVDTLSNVNFWDSGNPTTGYGTAAMITGPNTVHVDLMAISPVTMNPWDLTNAGAGNVLTGTWTAEDGCSFAVTAVRQ